MNEKGFGEGHGHLTAADFGFFLPVIHLRADRTENVAILPSKCILFCQVTSNGIDRSACPGSVDCLTGSCNLPAPSTSAVLWIRRRHGAAFDVRSAIADVGRLAEHDDLLIHGAAILALPIRSPRRRGARLCFSAPG